MTRPRIRKDEPGDATLNRSNGFTKYSWNNHGSAKLTRSLCSIAQQLNVSTPAQLLLNFPGPIWAAAFSLLFCPA
jgi:hypothetical protein